MKFRNPANGYEESAEHAWIWCLLFGCFYFAVKGVWTHAVGGFIAALVTYGISWLIYPFFAQQIMETHYLRKGWIKVANPNATVTASQFLRQAAMTPPRQPSGAPKQGG